MKGRKCSFFTYRTEDSKTMALCAYVCACYVYCHANKDILILLNL